MDIRIPDIGDFDDVPVIEVHVAPGDVVAPEDPILTLESDKATLDIPAPAAGTVGEVVVNVGDRVSEGDLVVRLEGDSGGDAPVGAADAERVHAGPPPSRWTRRATARPAASTTRSRSRSPTSVTSRTCP